MPPAALPAEVDVIVVGAGFTGLAAAAELARSGLSTAVLEAGRLGTGASSRNGGMAHWGLQHDRATLERRLGPAGRALHQASVDAYHHLLDIAGAGSCHLERCGWLELAHRRTRLAGLLAEATRRREEGETVRLLDRDGLSDELDCRGYAGGLLTDHGALLHPGRLLAAVARNALTAGAALHEGTEVTRIESDGRGRARLVTTRAGRIRAGQVLVATNGYTGAATPSLHRRLLPIGSYIVATEPLSGDVAATVTRHGRMLTDTRDFLFYWRLSPDRRLVLGGRTSFTPISLATARDRLFAALLRTYPQLHGTRVTHAWTGNVGFTRDRLPHLGQRDGVTHAMGYCGSGVAMANWFGLQAARWIAHGEIPAIAALDFPRLPLGAATRHALPVVGVYHQLRDRLL